MALLAFHCQNYKAGALVGIDGHNRRLHKNHKSNPDIDNERSANNIVYVAKFLMSILFSVLFFNFLYYFIIYTILTNFLLFRTIKYGIFTNRIV